MQTPIVLNSIDIFIKTRRKPFPVYFVNCRTCCKQGNIFYFVVSFPFFMLTHLFIIMFYFSTYTEILMVQTIYIVWCVLTLFSCSVSIREKPWP